MYPNKETAAFIIPNYSSTNKNRNLIFLKEALDSIYKQTDPNWHIIIVDDASKDSVTIDFLHNLQLERKNWISVIFEEKNRGQGVCRNIGIKYAYENGFPITLFNDADDMSHHRRLETVRSIFDSDTRADVVYSTFTMIDENNNPIPKNKITPSILDILNSHEINPPQGYDTWIKIGTETGYISLTSATSVRTSLAYRCPFPEQRVSEDAVTWMKYSALGGKFVYAEGIPSLYRSPQDTEGSSSRTREGGKNNFFEILNKVNKDGFSECIDICMQSGKLMPEQVDEIMIKFFIRQAKTNYNEKLYELAIEQLSNAFAISNDLALINIKKNNNNVVYDLYQKK